MSDDFMHLGETPEEKRHREEQEKKDREREKKQPKKAKTRSAGESREGEELDTGDVIAVYEFQEILGHTYIVKLYGPEPSHGPGEALDRLGISARSYPVGSYVVIHGAEFKSEIPEGVLQAMAEAAEPDELEAVPYADPRPSPEVDPAKNPEAAEERKRAKEESRKEREEEKERSKRRPQSEQLPAEPPHPGHKATPARSY